MEVQDRDQGIEDEDRRTIGRAIEEYIKRPLAAEARAAERFPEADSIKAWPAGRIVVVDVDGHIYLDGEEVDQVDQL